MTRVVAITGAARGIGLATARRLAAEGHAVALGDRDVALARQAAAELVQTGARAEGLPLDVTDPGSVVDFLSDAADRLGAPDVVIANAGVMSVGPFLGERPEVTQAQFAVNTLGVAYTARAALGPMLERGSGQLVVVASAASWLAPPGEASYAATKHAVRGLTRALRAELSGSGVAVSLVCPGVVDTELARGTNPGRAKLLRPEQVAEAIVRTIARPRAEVFVPRELGLVCRVWSALPPAAAHHLSRLLGLDAVAAAVDPSARAAYEARLTTTLDSENEKGTSDEHHHQARQSA